MSDRYTYCPYCATELIEQMRFAKLRLVCPNCDFIRFQDPKVAVIALVIHKGQVLLVRRAVNPAKGKWALPGGYMDAGEMPRQALEREIDEEVGLTIDVEELLAIYPMHNGPGQAVGIVLAFRATPANDRPGPFTVGDDANAAGWFASADIPNDLAFESTQTLIEEWLERVSEP